MDELHERFVSELQQLLESSAAISEACDKCERFLSTINDNLQQQENQQQINALQTKSLQTLAQHLETFKEIESSVAQQIFTSIDICAQKMTLLQSRSRLLQV